MRVPQFTLDDYERAFVDRHLLHGVIARWAKARPEAPALLSAEGNRTITWSEFDRITTALAKELLRLGFSKGDFLVTLLPLSVDHVLLEYGCFKIGVIVAPLDLRLSAAEVIRALEILRPRGFVSLGVKAPFDLRPLWSAVLAQCNWVEHCIVMASDEAIPGTRSYASIAGPAGRTAADTNPETAADSAALAGIASTITEDDGTLVIFTTGSTGSPKPALLSHRNITVQNMCMCGSFFGGDNGVRTLVNLPASHVGGQTEAMMSTFFGGGTAVLMEVFDASRVQPRMDAERL
jgi:acyl-CoA synthetase (AMP-forming)/AMP-acid ligase II